ncbi:Integrator complex subunit 8 [Eumeta japonica]|uniref:Integrator complex subunit 8 n=1 Tax=Eumeta variegata TaxID=151549 RepID=A0A4C1U6F8_EUMVA|nr:Integrator complex subunit 8 [Eumeta japonica]
MDVDLLRPGTVPISPDTILWFEFLLDPSLLRKHLSKQSPEPTACELIVEFLSVDTKIPGSKAVSERIVDVDAPPSPPAPVNPSASLNFTRKQLALKILALKVAATLRWNLGKYNYIFETKLPPQIQYQLMQDLVYIATDKAFLIPPVYDMAKKHILRCRENANLLERELSYNYPRIHELNKSLPWDNFHYASVKKEEICGYIRALNLSYDVLNEEPSLLQKLQDSVNNHYTGIISVLQADNLTREIPMVHRHVVEMDIQGSASSGSFTVARDLLNRISALNAVRYALEGGIPSTHPDFINKFKTVGIKFVDLLFWAFGPVLMSKLSDEDWTNLRIFFLHLVTSQCKFPVDRMDEYLRKHVGDGAENIRKKLISDEHFNHIINDPNNSDDENMEIPRELLTDDWETQDFELKAVPELEIGRLKKHLIEASTADDVRMCLVRLATLMAPSSPLWKLSPSWKPAGNLGNALVNLQRSFLQDFGYIVSGAARARAEAGCARTALSLLSVLEDEARRQLAGGTDHSLYRLCRLLSWEVLLLQVNVLLSEWPNHRLNLSALANKCKACIAVVSSGDSIVPRAQVIEACWTCLLNAREWEGAGVSGVTGPGEAAALLCAACFEIQRALSVYNNGGAAPVKRTAGGMPAQGRDSAASTEARTAFNAFLCTIREPLPATVACSLLARLHNVLVDDTAAELYIEYIPLWPSNISNVNSYNVKHVLESLTQLLDKSLRIDPYNISWLRLYGDIEAAAGRHGAALRRYLSALAAGSWYFAKRAPEEASIARRAARCCQALGAPTQAAALCQLPEEPDYALAFKCLAEKTSSAADAMDAYYGCLWDGTMLEVCVAMHARRGEGGRRGRAVRAAGALELNANNSEDIQREAAAVRRARLLRALAKQYVA